MLSMKLNFSGFLFILLIKAQVSGQYNNKQQTSAAQDRAHLQYLLQRLLGESSDEKRPPLDKAAAEQKIFAREKGQSSPNARVGINDDVIRYLDEAKEQLDVIDFRRSRYHQPEKAQEYVRRVRQNPEELYFSDTPLKRGSSSSASEQVPVKLAFPEPPTVKSSPQACTNCIPDGGIPKASNHFEMPLQRLGKKQYYLGIFFKANWYKAEQYCRFHGMHLASISSADEQKELQDHIQAYGMGHEHFWTSGTDQGEEGKFFWMSSGKPITYTNWNAGEPNNFEYEDGEQEHCLEMWDRDGKGLGWNDTPCSFQTYFICEA